MYSEQIQVLLSFLLCTEYLFLFSYERLIIIKPHWEPNGLSQGRLQCKTPYRSGCRKLARLSRVLFSMSLDCIHQTLSALGCSPDLLD